MNFRPKCEQKENFTKEISQRNTAKAAEWQGHSTKQAP